MFKYQLKYRYLRDHKVSTPSVYAKLRTHRRNKQASLLLLYKEILCGTSHC